MDEDLRRKLLELLKKEALRKGDFTLSSGKKSSYYLDGRVITLTPEGAYLTAKIILGIIREKGIQAFGGPTLGADPIVGAVAALSHLEKVPLKTFIVRKAAKEHGTQRRIEGPKIAAGAKVLLVDDVATTGKSLVDAAAALKGAGLTANEALVIVDRREGAAENLAAAGCKLQSIFKIEELGV